MKVTRATASRIAHLANASKISKSLKLQLSEATDTGRGALHNALTQRVFDFQRSDNTNQNKFFVGLDVSSRCTGIAVVNTHGKGIAAMACETHKYRDVIEVGRRLRTDIEDLLCQVETDVLASTKTEASSLTFHWCAGVEACAKSFTRGRFNAKGLVKLAQINGIAQYICAEHIGTVPLVVNPSTARTFYDLRLPPPPLEMDNGRVELPELPEQPVKERVFDFVNNRDLGKAWIPDFSSKSRLDISDAFLIAWYTRVNDTFQMLATDELLWTQFELELSKVKPAAARRDVVDVFHKYLWEWMREHKKFLRL